MQDEKSVDENERIRMARLRIMLLEALVEAVVSALIGFALTLALQAVA